MYDSGSRNSMIDMKPMLVDDTIEKSLVRTLCKPLSHGRTQRSFLLMADSRHCPHMDTSDREPQLYVHSKGKRADYYSFIFKLGLDLLAGQGWKTPAPPFIRAPAKLSADRYPATGAGARR